MRTTHSHDCYKFVHATVGLGLRNRSAHLPVFLHLRTTSCPQAVSCAVTPNKKDLNADKTNMNACRGDVHDRAPARQNHVSVSFLTPFKVGFGPCASCGFCVR